VHLQQAILTLLGLWMKNRLKAVIPLQARQWIRLQQTRASERPPFRMIRFGSLRRVEPIHRGFDTARGTFVDRHYMDKFLTRYAQDVKGRVLETGDNTYTRLYGGERVTHSDVLDVRKDYPDANIIADLTNAEQIPSNTYDCVILLQTLQLIYDMAAALKTVRRILKPSGVLLATFPGIGQICANEAKYCGDYWRLTKDCFRTFSAT
jgi:SAM-dependent methyltransferase